MTWFRVDDKLHGHRKVLALFDGPCASDALALWLLAGSWCGDQLTDGHVPESFVRRSGLNKKAASELVRVGLWAAADGGYQFHEWLKLNPSREDVLSEREAVKERVRKHRGGSSGNAGSNKTGNSNGNAARNTVTGAVTSGVGNGGGTGSPSRPVPLGERENAGAGELEDDEDFGPEPWPGLRGKDLEALWTAASGGQSFAAGSTRNQAFAAFDAIAKTLHHAAGNDALKAAWMYFCWLFRADTGPVRSGALAVIRPWIVQPDTHQNLSKAQAWFSSLPADERAALRAQHPVLGAAAQRRAEAAQ